MSCAKDWKLKLLMFTIFLFIWKENEFHRFTGSALYINSGWTYSSSRFCFDNFNRSVSYSSTRSGAIHARVSWFIMSGKLTEINQFLKILIFSFPESFSTFKPESFMAFFDDDSNSLDWKHCRKIYILINCCE